MEKIIYFVTYFDGSLAGPVINSAWTDKAKAERRAKRIERAIENNSESQYGESIGGVGVAEFDVSKIK